MRSRRRCFLLSWSFIIIHILRARLYGMLFLVCLGCKELPFLDVMIRKEKTCLTTDIYYKPTDSFQYLPYTSSHPRHTKNNIPYNLARRICMIIKDHDKRKQRLLDLKQILLDKNYPAEIINIGIEKAFSQTPEELRGVREQTKENNLLCLVTT